MNDVQLYIKILEKRDKVCSTCGHSNPMDSFCFFIFKNPKLVIKDIERNTSGKYRTLIYENYCNSFIQKKEN